MRFGDVSAFLSDNKLPITIASNAGTLFYHLTNISSTEFQLWNLLSLAMLIDGTARQHQPQILAEFHK